MKLLFFITAASFFSVGTPWMAKATEPVRAGRFEYVIETDGVPKSLFRKIENGLPAAIEQTELLADVDPQIAASWAFGWFTFGERSSRSVAVGLRDSQDLFVDIDRDRKFSLAEMVESMPGESNLWRTSIGAEFITKLNQYEQVDLSLLLRNGRREGTIEIATEGVMQGTVDVDGRELLAVRLDRDANGRWFDPRDRILLDTNGDGRLSPIGERISCDSICLLDGKRYVIQSDLFGEQLRFEQLSGVGTLTARLKLASSSASLDSISATLVSAGGVRVLIRQLDRKTECPVGDYRIEELTIETSDQETKYWFRFSGNSLVSALVTVAKDQSVDLSLLGTTKLIVLQTRGTSGGDRILTVHPRLITSNGLFLTGCRHGRGTATLETRLVVEASVDGRVIDTNSTGFS